MRICPKCSKTFDDGSKICRDCGAILNLVEVPQQEETPSDSAESVFADDQGEAELLESEWDRTPWRCPNCKESIEANFEACWNCGTNRSGKPESGICLRADGFRGRGTRTGFPFSAHDSAGRFLLQMWLDQRDSQCDHWRPGTILGWKAQGRCDWQSRGLDFQGNRTLRTESRHLRGVWPRRIESHQSATTLRTLS